MSENRYIKGLFKDTAHIDQPANTWRYAKNAIFNDKHGSISNEGGTVLAGHLGGVGSSYGDQYERVVGTITVNKNRVIFFVVDTDPSNPDPRSSIAIWENEIYTRIYRPNVAGKPQWNLKFSVEHPIEGTFKVDSKGDLIVYWTDDLNPPRAFNIDRQLRDSPSIGNLYGIYSPNLRDINILNLFPHAGAVPHIMIGDIGGSPGYQTVVKEGGGLRTGVYYLALAYVDDDLVATNFLTVSNPIPIVEEFDWTKPTTKKDGAKAGNQTTKSLTWRVSNLNYDYKFLRPVVIRKMGDATDAYKLNDVEIEVFPVSIPYLNITFSGIEGFSSGSVEEVIIDTVSYTTAKTIQQLDGVLYLGNLTASTDLGYQKYANNIKLLSEVKTITDFDVYWATVDNFETGFGNFPVDKGYLTDQTKSYRYIPNIFKYTGYTRDETYAFYIAFVLNDGSMSYGYHIPGRVADETTVPGELDAPSSLNDIYGDLEDISPSASKLFHWRDYSTIGGNNRMNYWENNTELYPNTENYEIWDNTGYTGNDLKGLNVRHHHFPSNWSNSRKSIVQGTGGCTTIGPSDGVADGVILRDGAFSFRHAPDGNETGFVLDHFRTATFAQNNPGSSTGTGAADAIALWSANMSPAANSNYGTNGPENVFTADQEMDVTVGYQVWAKTTGGGTPTECKIVSDATNPPISGSLGSNSINNFGGCGTGSSFDFCRGSGSVHLMAGEKIWIRCQSDGSDANTPRVRQARESEISGCDASCFSCFQFVNFEVLSTNATADPSWYNDAMICHDVRVLGFELEDVKVPKSIADKVQGFRIYRAKRDHSNRTILGQAPILPMSKHKSQIGICSEAVANSGDPDLVKDVLITLQENPEEFWNVDPWPLNNSSAILYSTYNDQSGGMADKPAHKVYSFHDFYLLRTHNSLAPATHVKLIYHIKNLAWNGPAIDQDKKMLPKVEFDGNGVKRVNDIWNWDPDNNCYPREINSAIFIGYEYANRPLGVQMSPRLLGQKAKTYLLGDSIFEGQDLGFGGKIFNEFGTSAVIFGLKDLHEIDSEYTLNSPDGTLNFGNAAVQTSTSSWDDYGYNQLGHASILVNPIGFTAPDGQSSHARRSQYWMANLGAFKSDLYKSLDSNELVFTGFEVLGDDFENYVFDDDTGSSTYGGATYKTDTTHPEGIFGGDTYLSRYGYSVAVKPSNADETSNPRRALHYQIVESTDNINFRHVESSDSFYFPNTPARTMLKYAGNIDFNHKDNIKYNDNYSAENDIRTVFPLPLRDTIQTDFPTRTHRSAKNDTTSLIDNYRVFLANQFKDLPKNRGNLSKLSTFNNLLYFHMEESLFAAKGKQSMSMKDGSEAFVGSGDIFQQDPDEIIQTKGGHGGTQSQWAAITTRHGYFFVDAAARKVFLMSDKLQEISTMGMGTWFRENLGFNLLASLGNIFQGNDNPITGMGLHAVWDPKYKRIILTKRDFDPTAAFLFRISDEYEPSSFTTDPSNKGEPFTHINPLGYSNILFQNGKFYTADATTSTSCSAIFLCWNFGPWVQIEFTDLTYFTPTGWTISYYPEMGIWGSFHDYVPYKYISTSTDFYSFTDTHPIISTAAQSLAAGTAYGNAGIWKHNQGTTLESGVTYGNRGILYQQGNIAIWRDSLNRALFEFEFIHNETKGDTLLYSAFDYTVETFNIKDISILNHGFTTFWIYNTFQIYYDDLEYLVNIRRIGNEWKVNRFRDMAALALNSTASGYYMSTNTNVTGHVNVGTITTSATLNMFLQDGMNETINASFIDLGKTWDQQRKFIDKWVGIRLIYDNISNNLLNLYATNVAVRNMTR